MTRPKWILDDDGFIYFEGKAIADFDINNDDIDDREQRKVMAVSAFNNTYGAGINPEAVPGLLEALKDIMELAEYGYSCHCADDYSTNQLHAELKSINRAKAAPAGQAHSSLSGHRSGNDKLN